MELPDIINDARAEILQPIADRGMRAVIAGGFVRDAILGRPYRDIDLYVNHVNSLRVHKILDIEMPEHVDWNDSDSRAYKHQSVMAQYESQSSVMGGCVINLILLNGTHDEVEPEVVVRKFNLGLCMAGISASDTYVAPEFWNDQRDRQITLLRTDWGHEASLKQWVKLQAKYPWPLRMLQVAA